MLGTILTIKQLIGFIIVITSMIIISYEKDSHEIDPQIKKRINSESGTGFLFSKLSVISHVDQALLGRDPQKQNQKLQIETPDFLTKHFLTYSRTVFCCKYHANKLV